VAAPSTEHLTQLVEAMEEAPAPPPSVPFGLHPAIVVISGD